MGFLSKVWKGVKGIVSGIGRVFKKILKPIGKILGSSWGKALMIGLSIFTFGTALLAGFSTFGSTAGSFLTKFVAGGKDFVGALLGKSATQGNLGGAGEAAAATTAQGSIEAVVPAVGEITKAGAKTVEAAANVAGGATSTGALPTGLQAAGAPAAAAVGPTKAAAALLPKAQSFGTTAGGWLREAAGSAKEFLKTPTGMNLAGNMLQGYSAGKTADREIASNERYDRMWQDPNNPGVQAINNYKPPETPNMRPVQDVASERAQGFQPSIPFRRYQPSGGQ